MPFLMEDGVFLFLFSFFPPFYAFILTFTRCINIPACICFIPLFLKANSERGSSPATSTASFTKPEHRGQQLNTQHPICAETECVFHIFSRRWSDSAAVASCRVWQKGVFRRFKCHRGQENMIEFGLKLPSLVSWAAYHFVRKNCTKWGKKQLRGFSFLFQQCIYAK